MSDMDLEAEYEEYGSNSESDSDTELQKAFAEGKLKGLSYAARQKPKPIYNKAGLLNTLKELRNGLSWLERLDLSNDPLRPPKVLTEQLGDDPDDLSGNEVHNDYKREMKFYRQAQAAVLEGCPRLRALGIATRRPDDYLAEMVKSDQHMDKVRRKLLSIKEGQERSEKAKKLREMRKFGKQVQKEVLSQRQKEKKEMLNAVKAFRKGKMKSLDFLEETPAKKKAQAESAATQSNKQQGNFTPSKKRQQKNTKFGFGGQKKRSKHNTKDSVNDIGSVPRFSTNSKGAGAKRKKGNKNRPGKANRQKARNRGKK